MTGWNMPPGCNVSDIPGNRPEDLRSEALYDKIYDCLAKLKTQDEDVVADLLFSLCNKVYREGYEDGMADEAMAQESKNADV